MQPAYMLIIGDEEAENGTVSIRNRAGDQSNGIALQDFIIGIKSEISSRSSDFLYQK